MILKDAFRDLETIGWHVFELPPSMGTDGSGLLDLLAPFGRARAGRNGLVEGLVPKSCAEAHINSLSGRFGFGPLPPHFDGTHHSQPPRYVALVCEASGPESAATTLVDWAEAPLLPEESELFRSANFLIRNGRRSFFSSILSPSRPFVRWDPGCMEPASSVANHAKVAMEERISRLTVQKSCWEPGKVLIFDNWRVLHGREACKKVETRSLKRVMLAR